MRNSFKILLIYIVLSFFGGKKLIAQIKDIFFKNNGFETLFVEKFNKELYFTDKKSVEIKKLGRWKKINREDYTALGFIRVEDDAHKKYLLNVQGEKLIFAESLEEFTNETQALEIRNVHLGKFPKKIFEFGKNLVFLCVDGTGIYELPKEIASLKNLKYLDISNNPIFELPNSIKELKFLEKINFSMCSFTQFPEILLENKNLTYIDIQFSQFTKLPLEKLKKLEKLNTLLLEIDEIPKKYFEEIKKTLPNCTFD